MSALFCSRLFSNSGFFRSGFLFNSSFCSRRFAARLGAAAFFFAGFGFSAADATFLCLAAPLFPAGLANRFSLFQMNHDAHDLHGHAQSATLVYLENLMYHYGP